MDKQHLSKPFKFQRLNSLDCDRVKSIRHYSASLEAISARYSIPGVENLSNLTQLQLIGRNSPVIGLTWSPPWLGKDKTIFRAGYGIAYERFTQVKPVVINRERNIVMILRGDAINLLNKPIWGNPSFNIDSTSFGQITSANGTRSINLTARA